MSAIFNLEKEPQKTHTYFMFLKGRYFVMGAAIERLLRAF